MLNGLATVPAFHESVPLTQQSYLLALVQRTPVPRKTVTVGAIVIQEFSPLPSAWLDEVRGNEVKAPRKDIGGLWPNIPRMSDSHRVDVCSLEG